MKRDRRGKLIYPRLYKSYIHLICYIDHMEPPEAGEKFGYKVIMEDGHVVDFLRKSKRRSGLRPVIRFF